jgi:hypothetical protein
MIVRIFANMAAGRPTFLTRKATEARFILVNKIKWLPK